jgi:hypothetical protein
VVFALRILSPTVYYYMIVVPKAFALNGPRAVRLGWEFLIDSPLFLVLVGEWIVSGGRSLRRSPRILWLFAALIVAVPYGAITTAKVGGWTNSLLPALLPLAAFCVLRLPALLRRLEDPASPLRSRLAFGTFVAILILMTTFPQVTKHVIVPHSPWQDRYEAMVGLAAGLPGTVVCPEDPTIPLHAKQFAGRNVYSENDTRLVDGQWPTTLAEPVVAEIAEADYVIDVKVTDGWYDAIGASQLRELGFEPARDLPVTFDCYQVWRRKGIDPPSRSERTASIEEPPALRQ